MRASILVVNKDAGMTSQKVVSVARRLLGERKIGHSGTLDPDVTGVLPLCIGQATRLIEYIQDQAKSYRAEVTFGFSTDTQDASGEVMGRGDASLLLKEHVEAALQSFRGEVWQQPPAYSALKIQGKRAYELARAGQEVQLAQRQITIHDIQLVSFQFDGSFAKTVFDVTCSKGTYVRTICHDLGIKLGCPAHMSHLIRTRSGPFTLDAAKTLAEIEEAVETHTIDSLLLSPRVAVAHLPVWEVNEGIAARIGAGQSISLAPLHLQAHWQEQELIQVVSFEQQLLALYRITRNKQGFDVAKPEKVFS